MKSWLKWSLIAVAVAGAAVSIRMAQTAFDAPVIAPAVGVYLTLSGTFKLF